MAISPPTIQKYLNNKNIKEDLPAFTIQKYLDKVRIKFPPGTKVPPPKSFDADVSTLTKLNDQLTVEDVVTKEYTLVTDPDAIVAQVTTLKEAQIKKAKEKAATAAYATTSVQLLDMLNNPEAYGFRRDTGTGTLVKSFAQSQAVLVLATYQLTQHPDLAPDSAKPFSEKLVLAQKLLSELKDAPTIQFTITPEAQALRDHTASLHQQATQELSPETLPQTAQAFLTHVQSPFVPPPTTIAPPPPTPALPPEASAATGAIRRKATQYTEAALKKFGGTVGNTLVNLKRGLQGKDAKGLAKAGAVITGFLLGGPIGAGVVMVFTSKRFRQLLAVLLTFVFSTFLTAAAAIFLVGSILAAFVILIVQNSAYVVPPSAGIPVEPGSGLSGDIGVGPGGAYPLCWPTYGYISQGPNPNHHTYNSSGEAIDIAGVNQDVYATHDGLAIPYCYGQNENVAAYGTYICINGPGFRTLYAHLSILYITSQTQVTAGTLLGVQGKTGTDPTMGIHLHYEIISSIYGINDIIPPYTLYTYTQGPPTGCFASQQGGSSQPPEAGGGGDSGGENGSETPTPRCVLAGGQCVPIDACPRECKFDNQQFLQCSGNTPVCCDVTGIVNPNCTTTAVCSDYGGVCAPNTCTEIDLPAGKTQWDCPSNQFCCPKEDQGLPIG